MKKNYPSSYSSCSPMPMPDPPPRKARAQTRPFLIDRHIRPFLLYSPDFLAYYSGLNLKSKLLIYYPYKVTKIKSNNTCDVEKIALKFVKWKKNIFSSDDKILFFFQKFNFVYYRRKCFSFFHRRRGDWAIYKFVISNLFNGFLRIIYSKAPLDYYKHHKWLNKD